MHGLVLVEVQFVFLGEVCQDTLNVPLGGLNEVESVALRVPLLLQREPLDLKNAAVLHQVEVVAEMRENVLSMIINN